MSASKKSSSKHRSSQRGEVVDAGKQQQQQQRHRDKRDRVSSPMSAGGGGGGGGGDGTRNNNGNYNGGASSRSNTPLHSPSSPNNNTDTSDFNTSYNTDTDTDDNFSPDREQQQYHQRTKSPTAQSVSSRAASASVRSSRIINDESVQLDLPMADLMAYLQVVANNSSNLPLTRRDDPELGRTVSSLTSEEYALKCAAFIPANVRILGGMYGKYGSVWDLPTSEVS